MELAVQHVDQKLGKDRPYPTRAAHEHVSPQQHHRADGIGRQRFANAGRMAPDEIELKLAGLLRGDAYVREFSEPGVDAVDRLAAGYGRFHGLARLLYSCARLGLERPGSLV